MPPTTNQASAAAAVPQQRRAYPAASSPAPRPPGPTGAPFTALVLADPAAPVAVRLHRTLVASGARDIRYASSAADLLRYTGAPAGSGVCIICASPGAEVLRQLVAVLRDRGWRRIVITGRGGEDAVRLAITSKIRCLVNGTAAGAVPRARPAAAARGALELSRREVEVLQAVADGHTNNEVGELLGLSGLTVKSHLARIGRKSGTGDRGQMVAMAMRAGLIT